MLPHLGAGEVVPDRPGGVGLSLRHPSALGRRTEVTAQSVRATLAHPEQLGAVQRRTPPGRGRTAQLHVTDEGLDLMHQGQRVIDEVGQQILPFLPADQQTQFTAVLLHAFTAAAQNRKDAPAPQPPTG